MLTSSSELSATRLQTPESKKASRKRIERLHGKFVNNSESVVAHKAKMKEYREQMKAKLV
jgi:2C-methyl-D-erythritol 2,4-cyclodiphosphate synthase